MGTMSIHTYMPQMRNNITEQSLAMCAFLLQALWMPCVARQAPLDSSCASRLSFSRTKSASQREAGLCIQQAQQVTRQAAREG